MFAKTITDNTYSTSGILHVSREVNSCSIVGVHCYTLRGTQHEGPRMVNSSVIGYSKPRCNQSWTGNNVSPNSISTPNKSKRWDVCLSVIFKSGFQEHDELALFCWHHWTSKRCRLVFLSKVNTCRTCGFCCVTFMQPHRSDIVLHRTRAEHHEFIRSGCRLNFKYKAWCTFRCFRPIVHRSYMICKFMSASSEWMH